MAKQNNSTNVRFEKAACCPASAAHELQLGQYIPVHYHYNMLLDQDRVEAFKSAIEFHVQADMHVLELGGGTGILSSFAARRGAAVTCVERNPALVGKAQQSLRLNGLENQVTVIQVDASQYVPDRPVDVVICEMLHVAMLREKQLDVIAAFKTNYANQFSGALPIFIPEASVLLWQAIEQDFDFSGYWSPLPLFRPPLVEDPRVRELTPLEPYASLDYGFPYPLRFDVDSTREANAAGEWNAVRFLTQNVLAIDMSREEAITWPNQCLILPVEQTHGVAPGQQLRCAFHYRAGDPLESLASTLQCSTKTSALPSQSSRNQAAA